MRYVLQRLAQGLLVLLGVTTIVFALTFVAGDPVATLAPLEATPEERAAFAHNMGLDRPIPVQYVDFLAHAVRGDFGMSYSSHEPAMGEVLDRLPATILLTAAAVLFALVVSVPLGLLLAGICVTAGFSGLLPKWVVISGLVIAAIGELSWLQILIPQLLFLIPLTRFPGFAWMIVAGFSLPSSVERVGNPDQPFARFPSS